MARRAATVPALIRFLKASAISAGSPAACASRGSGCAGRAAACRAAAAGAAREQPAEGDARLEPRHVHAGAGMGALAEGQVRVRLAADVQPVRLVEHRGVAVGAPMASVTKLPAGSSTSPMRSGAVHRRLFSCSGLSKRSSSSTAVPSSAGCASSRSHCSRCVSSACVPLPIRLVVVSWPALSRKMQLCSSSSSPEAPQPDRSRPGSAASARRRAGRRGGAGVRRPASPGTP